MSNLSGRKDVSICDWLFLMNCRGLDKKWNQEFTRTMPRPQLNALVDISWKSAPPRRTSVLKYVPNVIHFSPESRNWWTRRAVLKDSVKNTRNSRPSPDLSVLSVNCEKYPAGHRGVFLLPAANTTIQPGALMFTCHWIRFGNAAKHEINHFVFLYFGACFHV